MGNVINDDLDLSSSDDETGSESDNETEFDNDEWFNSNKSLIVHVNHSLLGFYTNFTAMIEALVIKISLKCIFCQNIL